MLFVKRVLTSECKSKMVALPIGLGARNAFMVNGSPNDDFGYAFRFASPDLGERAGSG
jgi:hypothetical protein